MTGKPLTGIFRNKTAVITGAGSGLGKVLSHDLATRGANLVLADRNQEALAEVAAEITKRTTSVVAHPTDVTVPEDCRSLIELAVRRFHRIDYLILCAGISMWARFEEITDLSVFRRVMDINFLGIVHCIHPALPWLRKSRGTIVTISSTQGVIGLPNHTGYSASKHAVNGFLEALESEMRDEVRILNVLPGWIRGTNLRSNALTADGTTGGKTRKHSKDSVSVEESSLAILEAIEHRKRELYLPPKLRFVPWVKLLFPGWLRSKIRRAVEEQDRT